MKKLLFLLFIFGWVFSAEAQDEQESWDVNNPPGSYQELEFSTSEGTWMNVDVSLDGKQIVFYLLRWEQEEYPLSLTGMPKQMVTVICSAAVVINLHT